MADVIIAVLNGGHSRRMGADKARLDIAGRALSSWVQRALAGHNSVFVGGSLTGVRTIEDASGEGPLAGLAAALTIGADAVMLVAIDQPWLRTTTINHLIDRYDGRPVVPLDDDIRQVTCAIYPSGLAVRAGLLAADGRALQALFDDAEADEVPPAEWTAWGEDGRSWFGVNTPEDVVTGLDRYGVPGSGLAISD